MSIDYITSESRPVTGEVEPLCSSHVRGHKPVVGGIEMMIPFVKYYNT
jgi:hypothetical protein